MSTDLDDFMGATKVCRALLQSETTMRTAPLSQVSSRHILPNVAKQEISAQSASARGPVGVSKPLPKKLRRGGRRSKDKSQTLLTFGSRPPPDYHAKYLTSAQIIEDCFECKRSGTMCIPDRLDPASPCIPCSESKRLCSRLYDLSYNWTFSIRVVLPHRIDVYANFLTQGSPVETKGAQEFLDGIESRIVALTDDAPEYEMQSPTGPSVVEDDAVHQSGELAYRLISDPSSDWDDFAWDTLQRAFRIAFNPRRKVDDDTLACVFCFMYFYKSMIDEYAHNMLTSVTMAERKLQMSRVTSCVRNVIRYVDKLEESREILIKRGFYKDVQTVAFIMVVLTIFERSLFKLYMSKIVSS